MEISDLEQEGFGAKCDSFFGFNVNGINLKSAAMVVWVC